MNYWCNLGCFCNVCHSYSLIGKVTEFFWFLLILRSYSFKTSFPSFYQRLTLKKYESKDAYVLFVLINFSNHQTHNSYSTTFFTMVLHYIYVIHRQTVLLYHNSSVWLDTPDIYYYYYYYYYYSLIRAFHISIS